jgi:membrane associated rhomboid family serine protease
LASKYCDSLAGHDAASLERGGSIGRRGTVDTPVRITADRRLGDEWALVLLAEGVTARVQRASEGYALRVRDVDVERATSTLDLYESENPPAPAAEIEPDHAGALDATLVTMAALLIFFLVTGARDASNHWFEAGSADAERILSGELWRTVTALTLHADFRHVLGNVFAGAVFLTSVGRSLGPGLAIVLALVAGAGGNFANAVLHGTAHSAVGASTSVFGAVGLLGGRGVVRRGGTGMRGHRRFTPLAGGLALLAMLGTGARADFGAHLLGLLVGAGLGVLVARTLRRPPPIAIQWMLGATAILTVLYCWGVALD